MNVYIYSSGIMSSPCLIRLEELNLDNLITATKDFMEGWNKKAVDDSEYSIKYSKFDPYGNQFKFLEKRVFKIPIAGRKTMSDIREFNYSLNSEWTKPLGIIDGKLQVVGKWKQGFMYKQPRYADANGNVVHAYHFYEDSIDPDVVEECGIRKIEYNNSDIGYSLNSYMLLDDCYIASTTGKDFAVYSRKYMHEKYPFKEWMLREG